jgi:hypothetical protein
MSAPHWGGRAVGVFTVSLITLEIGSVVSHRGDIVRGKAKSHAVAFADACRNHWTSRRETQKAPLPPARRP